MASFANKVRWTYFKKHDANRHQRVAGVVLVLSYSYCQSEAIGIGSSADSGVSAVSNFSLLRSANFNTYMLPLSSCSAKNARTRGGSMIQSSLK